MMNPITCVCVLMAAGSGLYLFQEKQQVQLLDRQIEQVLHAVDAAHARTGMLRAEYALLNDPSRLQELARQHLPALVNTAPAQFANLAELDRRLATMATAPVAPAEPNAPPPVVASPAPVVVAATQAIAAPGASVPAVLPAAQARHPVPRIAHAAAPAEIVAAPGATLVAASQPAAPVRVARPPSRAANPRLASRHSPNMRLAYAVHGNPYPTQPVIVAEARPVVPHAAPTDPGSPLIGSALGMARSMAAPGPAASTIAASFTSGGPQPQ